MKRSLPFVASLLLLSGCGGVGKLTVRYDQIGEYGNTASTPQKLASADQVKVYYGSAPKGFSLKENELKVEPGYNHQILGAIKAFNHQGVVRWKIKEYNKNFIISQLKAKAYEKGANAIIYAHSATSEDPTIEEFNSIGADPQKIYGSAWAVVLNQ